MVEIFMVMLFSLRHRERRWEREGEGGRGRTVRTLSKEDDCDVVRERVVTG